MKKGFKAIPVLLILCGFLLTYSVLAFDGLSYEVKADAKTGGFIRSTDFAGAIIKTNEDVKVIKEEIKAEPKKDIVPKKTEPKSKADTYVEKKVETETEIVTVDYGKLSYEKYGVNADTYKMTEIELEVIRLVNVEREKEGLLALKAMDKLGGIATIKTQDMLENKYFSHTSPVFEKTAALSRELGTSYKRFGENLACGYDSPEEVVQAWMNSERHRKNIMSPEYEFIGVSYIDGVYTQLFLKQ